MATVRATVEIFGQRLGLRADGDAAYAESVRMAGERDGGRGVLVVFETPSADAEPGGRGD